jgi:hypothetical protein
MAEAEEIVARYLRDFNNADGALLLSLFSRFLRKHAPALYRDANIEWEDRLQDVAEGFLKSLPTFDPAKGRLNAWALLYLRDVMRASAESVNPASGTRPSHPTRPNGCTGKAHRLTTDQVDASMAAMPDIGPRISKVLGRHPANFGRSALRSIAVIGRCRGCRQVFSSGRNDRPRRGRCNI